MMKASDLDAALAIARSDRPLNIEDLSIFDGFGLPDFKPITCTVEALAMLIRWQCFQLNGEINAEASQEIATYGKRRFSVLNGKAVA